MMVGRCAGDPAQLVTVPQARQLVVDAVDLVGGACHGFYILKDWQTAQAGPLTVSLFGIGG